MDMPEIEDCLIMPPSLEARAISFNVKEDRKQDFENEFNKRFKDTYSRAKRNASNYRFRS